MREGVNFDASQMLEIGDVVISERTAVERKGGQYNYESNCYQHDFVASIKDGRNIKQAYKMKQQYENCIWIIEEFNRLYEDCSVPPSAITSMMTSLTTKFGIHIIPTSTVEETVNVLVKLEEYDNEIGYYRPVNKHAKSLNVSEQQVFLLTGLLHVEFNRAVDLLTTLKTPQMVIDEILKARYIIPPRGRKKKWISVFDSIKGFGQKFVEDNMLLLTRPFDPSEIRVNI